MLASPPSMSLVGIRYTGSQLTPWLLLTLWSLLLLAQLWLRSQPACMVARRRRRYTTAAAAAAAAAAAVYPGVVKLQFVTGYGSPSPSLCR